MYYLVGKNMEANTKENHEQYSYNLKEKDKKDSLHHF